MGWYILAFLAGGVVTTIYFTHRKTLRERLAGIVPLVGREYGQIISEMKVRPKRTIQEINGQILREWREGNYYVSLLFDRNDICLGVMDEKG